MKVRQLAEYLQSLPDQDSEVAFAEWNHDGWHFCTPPGLPETEKPWTVVIRGLTHRVVAHWDNCRAHKCV